MVKSPLSAFSFSHKVSELFTDPSKQIFLNVFNDLQQFGLFKRDLLSEIFTILLKFQRGRKKNRGKMDSFNPGECRDLEFKNFSGILMGRELAC